MSVNNSSEIDSLTDSTGHKITDSKKICDLFNDYFSNIGPNIASNIPNTGQDFMKYLDTNCLNSFSLMPMGPWKVLDVVHSLSDKYTQDINEISVWLLRQIIHTIAEPLAHILDLSIYNGIFPSCFKCSKVVPVYKSGAKDDIKNYRPISIINVFGKVLEKYVADQLLHFFLKENLFSPSQHGFLPRKNTFNCILSVFNIISNNLLSNETTAIISLDLSKAFDLCNHDIILKKLSAYGVRGIPLKWFESFLQNRTQMVTTNGTLSSSINEVRLGVPQGSIIGVLLFLVYVNDLPNCTELPVHSYADDSTFVASAKTSTELEEKINQQLPLITEWFHSNRLCINFKKSNYMVFMPKLTVSPRLDINIQDNGQLLSLNQIPSSKGENSIKLLGFHIDEKLSLKYHIGNLCKSLNKSIFFLSRVKRILPLYCKKQLYFAHIHSHLMYCLPLLSMAYKTDINKLEKLQRKALRITYNFDYRAETLPLYHDIETLSVTELIEKNILKFMQNVYSYRLPKEFGETWSVDIKDIYSFRYAKRFYLPLVKSIRLSYLPLFKFAEIFNNFPKEFKWLPERRDFLLCLEEHYHQEYKLDSCVKRFCKICSYDTWKKRQESFVTSPPVYDYIRYGYNCSF